eukprot:gnl/TRDRNA2_/TRDRNA2_171254_c1_seq1.p1 gnl/TRDRNA2_/TRDRNA2_171254_c1~~gnl/TRDRNA2_/TRDRNA2_171254_c1_seq1.p1  ORF type:complete len:412 (+),score=85.83 gnl/TRDRNA2_/TRDRNA2_171254_c1_seq1:173-1237(+)
MAEPASQEHPQLVVTAEQAMLAEQQWEVVGGLHTGGILVREGRANSSKLLPQRLSTGAVVEKLALSFGRLHFRLVSGAGPSTGWVSISHRGQDLLVRRDSKYLGISLEAASPDHGQATIFEQISALEAFKIHSHLTGAPASEDVTDAQQQAILAAQPQQWEVIGGLYTGGILVREGQSSSSVLLPQRLSTGAIIEQMELDGGRLRFQLVSGIGPSTGWVGISHRGQDLLVRRGSEQHGVSPDDASPVPVSDTPESIDQITSVDIEQITTAARRWQVTGGLQTGGILVREGRANVSKVLPQRLSTGAIVEKLALSFGRLHFRLVSGVGPATGWVSISHQGRELLVPTASPGDSSA